MAKIVIANMMRSKTKQAFFALHQIQKKIYDLNPQIEVEFHILWDTDPTDHEKQDDPRWAPLIDQHIRNIHSYSRQFFKDYATQYYGEADADRYDQWLPIYFILMGHYLRRVKLVDYYLIYDDDILLNDDFSVVLDLMLQHIPVLITEPMNMSCDKVLFRKLAEVYGNEFVARYQERNPQSLGVNAGFQGIDLSIYDQFLSVDRFEHLLSFFTIRSHFNEQGEEIWGNERFYLDTQQQSFTSLMNVVLARNTPHILNPQEYFVVPNWGVHPTFGKLDPEDEMDGWGLGLRSKITHFIGHTRGLGKPPMLLRKVDEYLTAEGFEV